MTKEAEFQEYDDNYTTVLEAVWGEGFLSPGGPPEVGRIVAGLDLGGARILDIGCGIGGADIYLAGQGAAEVVGVDIEPGLKPKAETLAERHNLSGVCRFVTVEPGPLPFEDGLFDLVFSKDAIIHIADKHALARDAFRLVKPGGVFAASDWLAGYAGEQPPEMQTYVEAEGLDFSLADTAVYGDALEAAGFTDVGIDDRNAWYREEARRERDTLARALYDDLHSVVDRDLLDGMIEVWDKMIVALDLGYLRPTHLRAVKAA